MPIDLQTVERLAPDQAALKAASGLVKPAKWSLLARAGDSTLIWGECQGSGAAPYRVMADTDDAGSKCTCPSRKFPCKHALALFWLFADKASAFTTVAPPDWVADWVGRRRKTGGAPKADDKPAPAKNLHEARAIAEEVATLDPAAEAKRIAAAEKRSATTKQSVSQGLDDLEQWIADQLRLGLSGFIGDAPGRCRRIAARLVDAKATTLAGRVDEMPARLLRLAPEERPDAAVMELGKLSLLARAWRADPDDAELRRAVTTAEARDDVIANADAPRETGLWEVVAERIETRRDGLVARESWLLRLDGGATRFAQLLDFSPASAGRRSAGFTPGEQFAAELVFYPAREPQRALIVKREPAFGPDAILKWPDAVNADPLAAMRNGLSQAPWVQDVPIRLPPGRIAADPAGRPWWRPRDSGLPLPLAADPPALARGADLDAAVAIWTGARIDLLAAQTSWGRVDFAG